MNNLSFTKQENKWLSNSIVATKPNMVIHVRFPGKVGDISIERSITGSEWVTCGLVRGDVFGTNVLEFNISGIVTGQNIRISSNEDVVGGYLE